MGVDSLYGPRNLTRREILAMGAGAFAAFQTGYEGGARERSAFDRNHYTELLRDRLGTRHLYSEVGVPGLPASADGLTVVFLTDIHAEAPGKTRIDPCTMRYTVKCINALTASLGLSDRDILLGVGGDVANHDAQYFLTHDPIPETTIDDYRQTMNEVDGIRAYARIATEGNHEYASTARDEYRRELQKRGYVYLGYDQFCTDYRGVRVLGFPDFTSDAVYAQRAFYGDNRALAMIQRLLATDDHKIVFSHTPSFFDQSVVPVNYKHVHGFSGHLHGLHAQNVALVQRSIHAVAEHEIRQRGFAGNIIGSQVDPSRGSTIEVCAGVGNHPRYNSFLTPRFSPYSVVYKRFREADKLTVSPHLAKSAP